MQGANQQTGRPIASGIAVAAVVAVGVMTGAAPPTRAGEVTVGRGSYTTTLPRGAKPPRLPRDLSLPTPLPTNDWWTPLVWPRRPAGKGTEPLYAHPLAFRGKVGGLGVGYPTRAAIDPKGRSYHYHYAEDLSIGAVGVEDAACRVTGFSDWSVRAAWSRGPRRLVAEFGHGLPCVYCSTAGGEATVTFRGKPAIWHRRGGVVGATVNGHHYGLFAPAGSTWTGKTTLRSSPPAKGGCFTVALLPERSAAALTLFGRHALAAPGETRVTWRYDRRTATLTTEYRVGPPAGGGAGGQVLLALYPHQWKNTDAKLTAYTYVSPRGSMKLLAPAGHAGTGGFTTKMTFHGVLPGLPAVAAPAQRRRLGEYVRAAAAAEKPLGTKDTYWTGKALGRLAALAHVSDAAGCPDQRDRFLRRIKSELEDWFRASPGKRGKLFYHDAKAGALIGYPAGYGSDTDLNDHHFHYGYFIMAAAAVARFDPDWARPANWGGMVELLIDDAACRRRGDKRFPYLRTFDASAGHSWASGPAAFAAGNNQESSSESLNFAAAVILWGAATGNDELRDLGIYLYATETRAVQQYWLDVDRDVFPKGFRHSCLGILWGNGGAYATWWTANPEEIHGINFLPITGGSLYLGRRGDAVKRNYADLVATNGGPETEWRDLIWSFQALADPTAAAAKLEKQLNYKPTSGESKAHTVHWIQSLKALGPPDTTVTADVPTYAVFGKRGARTCVAWNPGPEPITVTFSNGTKLPVAAHALATRREGDDAHD